MKYKLTILLTACLLIAANLPPKPMMKIDTSVVKPIKLIYGIDDITQNTGNGPVPCQDYIWQSYIKQLTSCDDFRCSGGSLAIQTHYYPGANGYGGSPADCILRGIDFTQANSGRLAMDYEFECLKSDITLCDSLHWKFSPVLNPSSPVIDSKQYPYINAPLNYTRIQSEVKYIMGECSKAGVKIGTWYIGEEDQIGNTDIFPNLGVFVNVTTGIAAYIYSQDATADICCDAQTSDVAACRFNTRTQTMNGAMRLIPHLSGDRQYFQIQNFTSTPTPAMILGRLNEYHGFIDKNQIDFPGWAMHLTQQQFDYQNGLSVALSPYTDKWGQAIVMSDLLMQSAIESANRGLTIKFSHSQINGLVSGARSDVKPEFYAYRLLQGMIKNDGLVNVSFQNISGSENLLTAGVKRGNLVEVYILNVGDTDVTIPVSQVNGHHRNFAITDGWGGNWSDAAATNYAPNTYGDNLLIKAHYLVKIVSDK